MAFLLLSWFYVGSHHTFCILDFMAAWTTSLKSAAFILVHYVACIIVFLNFSNIVQIRFINLFNVYWILVWSVNQIFSVLWKTDKVTKWNNVEQSAGFWSPNYRTAAKGTMTKSYLKWQPNFPDCHHAHDAWVYDNVRLHSPPPAAFTFPSPFFYANLFLCRWRNTK